VEYNLDAVWGEQRVRKGAVENDMKYLNLDPTPTNSTWTNDMVRCVS